MSEEATRPSINKFEESVKMYELYREYVRHEDGLVNYRMTWLLTIHGFLYATYGFTMQTNLQVSEKYFSDTNSSLFSKTDSEFIAVQHLLLGKHVEISFSQIEVFMISIAFVGIAISLSAVMSI